MVNIGEENSAGLRERRPPKLTLTKISRIKGPVFSRRRVSGLIVVFKFNQLANFDRRGIRRIRGVFHVNQKRRRVGRRRIWGR